MLVLAALSLLALCAAQQAETCGPTQDVKLYSTNIGASASSVFYIQDENGDDETDLFIVTDDSTLFSSRDGGAHWTDETANMPGFGTEEAPFFRKGVHAFYASTDGSKLWVTSFRTGFWKKSRGDAAWVWKPTGTDILIQIFQHPTVASTFLGIFRSEGCYNSSAPVSCKSYLRVTRDAGDSFTELSTQVIQVFWSTSHDPSSIVFFSEHNDPNGNFYNQGWHDSKLFKGVLGSSGGWQSKFLLLDKQAGAAYKEGVLLAAERLDENSGVVNLYSSTTDGVGGLDKAIFRNFFDDEIEAQQFNILDVTPGSIMINVRTTQDDRGDLYVSGALDHDFELVLPDNVRSGARADVSKLASLRGVYLANVYVPPDDKVVTGITYDNGANWDFVQVPDSLKSACNASSSFGWCGMHFLGRSNSGTGEPPYSAVGATGIAMATGNVGATLALDSPDDLATFITRDGGVTWKKIADGDNLYAMADRGAVVMWVPDDTETSILNWSWDEGKTASVCAFGTLGTQTVTTLTTSPSKDGLRFHLFTERAGEHFVVTVDFSNLAAAKCTGEDKPNTPASNYETWVPMDPDGPAGCLLGTKTTYVRRKPNVQCFNVDNDLVQSNVPCTCSREDFECDDCYEPEQFWVEGSPCVRKVGPCYAPDPCANGQTYYNQTRGYRRVPADECQPGTDDVWSPVPHMRCSARTTVHVPPTTTTPHPPLTTRPGNHDTTRPRPPTATTSPAPSSGGGGGYSGIIAVVVILLLVAGLVGAFLYFRKQPSFRARFGGRIPFVTAPEDPYSTLGELDTSGGDFDADF